MTQLPQHDIVRNVPKYVTNLKLVYGNKIPEASLNLLERILVYDPVRRSSAKIALTNKFFLMTPLPPIEPADIEPLNIAIGASFHEYKTKLLRKQREEDAKNQADAATSGVVVASSFPTGGPPPPPPGNPPIPSSIPRAISSDKMNIPSYSNNNNGAPSVGYSYPYPAAHNVVSSDSLYLFSIFLIDLFLL